jgi:hypothetical protein
MIDEATVWFTNGKSVDVEKVTFKDGGWIGLRASDGWVYYPPHQVARVLSR